jgi:hypothetical protein
VSVLADKIASAIFDIYDADTWKPRRDLLAAQAAVAVVREALLSDETIEAAAKLVPAHEIDPPLTVRYCVRAALDAVTTETP